jgi:hypothetical protein
LRSGAASDIPVFSRLRRNGPQPQALRPDQDPEHNFGSGSRRPASWRWPGFRLDQAGPRLGASPDLRATRSSGCCWVTVAFRAAGETLSQASDSPVCSIG